MRSRVVLWLKGLASELGDPEIELFKVHDHVSSHHKSTSGFFEQSNMKATCLNTKMHFSMKMILINEACSLLRQLSASINGVLIIVILLDNEHTCIYKTVTNANNVDL